MDNLLQKKPDQFGYVFADIEEGIKLISGIYGLSLTKRFDFKIEQHWVHGEHFPIHLDIALCIMDDIEYELIQPLSDGPHKWFLDKTGGGLNHLGYYVDDYQGVKRHLESVGMRLLMNAETDVYKEGEDKPDHHIIGGYFEYPGTESVWIEVVERNIY